MRRIALYLAGALAAVATSGALAQQPPAPPTPPPPTAFAAPNLTESGVRSMAATCAMCHGTGGKAAPGSVVPGLAGRPAAEMVTAMKQFQEGKRPATIMHQIAKGYGEAEVAALADYFARQR